MPVVDVQGAPSSSAVWVDASTLHALHDAMDAARRPRDAAQGDDALERLRELSVGEIALAEPELELERPLGEGAFSTVSLCMLRVGQADPRFEALTRAFPTGMVAVKRMKPMEMAAGAAGPDKSQRGAEVALRMEATVLKSLNHPNLVGCIGCFGTPTAAAPFLALEFLPGGSLRDAVARRRYEGVQALAWTLDVARAMSHLHQAAELATPPPRAGAAASGSGPAAGPAASVHVMHRDLKLENVLLSADGTAKVCDLGLARVVVPRGSAPTRDDADPAPAADPADVQIALADAAPAAAEQRGRGPPGGGGGGGADGDVVYTAPTGSERYMAPENWRGHGRYSRKVDVFAFGILAFELLSQGRAYEGLYLSSEQIVRTVAERGLRPALPSRWPVRVATLITRCWDEDPELRPEFAEVVHELEALRDECPRAELNELFGTGARRSSGLGGLCTCVVA